MITSAANEGWTGDVAIGNHVGAGLPVASVVRAVKVATIEAGRAERVGRLPRAVLDEVMMQVRHVVEPRGR